MHFFIPHHLGSWSRHQFADITVVWQLLGGDWLFLLPMDMLFQWFVDCDLNRLAEAGKSTREMYYLYIQILYGLHYWCHHIASYKLSKMIGLTSIGTSPTMILAQILKATHVLCLQSCTKLEGKQRFILNNPVIELTFKYNW